ncbi:hypothetical protein OU798_24430 [Prolixibacteraceae bacterium Z1-6]|uniref:Uncharacterized protein n=1 Tax=Draconibacterium aestuarii TaxID=2998507 RepID=A0A9X3FE95_9BACT|nr:hypothetical protein [Prolixibacteraceae bacterium Z1-6]
MKYIQILISFFCLFAIWQQQAGTNNNADSFAIIGSEQESWMYIESADIELSVSVLDEVVEVQDAKIGLCKNRRGLQNFQIHSFVSLKFTNQDFSQLLLLQHYTNLPPPLHTI